MPRAHFSTDHHKMTDYTSQVHLRGKGESMSPCTRKVEAGAEFKAILGYMGVNSLSYVKPCLKQGNDE